MSQTTAIKRPKTYKQTELKPLSRLFVWANKSCVAIVDR